MLHFLFVCLLAQLWSTFNTVHVSSVLHFSGFRREAKGAAVPSLFLVFSKCFTTTVRFCFQNRLIKCSLILPSEPLILYTILCITNTLTMLYAACPEK